MASRGSIGVLALCLVVAVVVGSGGAASAAGDAALQRPMQSYHMATYWAERGPAVVGPNGNCSGAVSGIYSNM